MPFIRNSISAAKAEIRDLLKMHFYYGAAGRLSTFLTHRSLSGPKKPSAGAAENPPNIPQVSDKEKETQELLQLETLNEPRLANFPADLRIVVVSYSVPQPDKASSDCRLYHLLDILSRNRARIDFLYCAHQWQDHRYLKNLPSGVHPAQYGDDPQRFVDFIVDRQPHVLWVTELWRLAYLDFVTRLCEGLNIAGYRGKLIIDTVDFHHKEFQRKYVQSGNEEDRRKADAFLEREKRLYPMADALVVVSGDEKKDIAQVIPAVKHIDVVPNIHRLYPDAKPRHQRRHMCFVGHFGNKHNVDAIRYFVEHIFDLISWKNPDVELHVIGYLSENYKGQFSNARVKCLGGFKHLSKVLPHYKLFVCPMQYGAGMKGKIGDAIAAGIPIVTTSIGAEGFPVTDGVECFIAETPAEFAEKCHRCLNDPAVWRHFNVRSKLMLANISSPSKVAEKLAAIFDGQAEQDWMDHRIDAVS